VTRVISPHDLASLLLLAAEEEGGDETELLETTAEISDNEISPINGTLGIASFDITAAFHNAPMPASNYTRTP
jgi:hypothetical protein